jgi:hypothetical protein
MRGLLAVAGVAIAAAIWACGPTVGDACTTAAECGLGTCLQGPGTPGGYCSRGCSEMGRCPSGSACIAGAGAGGADSCLLLCAAEDDCRSGYRCRVLDAGLPPVCAGLP